MALSYGKQDTIGYNATNLSEPLQRIIEQHGDCLEHYTEVQKLHLVARLSFWRAMDIAHGEHEYSLAEALDDYAVTLPNADLIDNLKDLNHQEAIDLLVALINQVKDGVYKTS